MPIYTMEPIDSREPVYSLRFSCDGKYLATGREHVAQVFDCDTGQELSILDHRVNQSSLYFKALCFSPNNECLLAGGLFGGIRVS